MMMSGEEEEAFPVPSNTRCALFLVHEPNSNPSPNPNSSNPVKKKRNLPGTPDPDAEVIALSPKSLTATNRFICEICNKGFQRDQNLQLHRRGHNLPWKLRQRSNKELLRKKVYVCPEKSCVHHDPCRALGDLTGIKKHYSRKHGEKKWNCDKCSKKYAVQSDWKAHTKICGTREYKCDCGSLFSRKDSFITHRAFCDALAEESARMTSVSAALSLTNFRSDHLINAQACRIPQTLLGLHPEFGGSGSEPLFGNFADADHGQKMRLQPLWLDQQGNSQLLHPLGFPSNSSAFSSGVVNPACTLLPDLVQTMNMFGSFASSANLSMPAAMLHGLKLEQEENKGDLSRSVSALYPSNQNPQGGPTHMSATALLQKASQMGSTSIINDENAAFNNSSSVFGLMGSNLSSSTPGNNRNNNDQNLFKQANQAESFNQFVSSQASTNFGGGFSLNDSNSSSFGIVTTSTKNLDHVVMPVDEDQWRSRPPPTGGRQLHSSSNINEDQLGLTRDFLGVGDNNSISRPFLHQKLAKFNDAIIGSVMDQKNQYGGHH